MDLCITLHEYGSAVDFYNMPVVELIKWSSRVGEYERKKMEALRKARKK